MKKLILALALLLAATSTPMAATKAQKTYDNTVKSIMEDIHSDIRYWSHCGKFKINYDVRYGLTDDALNKVILGLVREGYSVTFDFLPPDFDDVRIHISWENTRG